MRKSFVALLVSLLAITLAACSSGSGKSDLTSTPAVTTAPPAPPSPVPVVVTPPPGCSTLQLNVKPEGLPVSGTPVINGANGVTLTGSACVPYGMTVWAFDYDPNDYTPSLGKGNYFMDENQNGDNGPILFGNVPGSQTVNWSDQPIGEQGNNQTPNTVVLVLADQSCGTWLAHRGSDPGDVRVHAFLPGCKIVYRYSILIDYN